MGKAGEFRGPAERADGGGDEGGVAEVAVHGGGGGRTEAAHREEFIHAGSGA
jgi:hypothetical protein